MAATTSGTGDSNMEMQASVRDMTTICTSLAEISLPLPSPQPLLLRMRLSHLTTFRDLDAPTKLQQQAFQHSTPHLILFVSDFTTLLTALVPQLRRQGDRLSSATFCSVGTPEEELFWELWRFLVTSCSVFGMSFNYCNERDGLLNVWPQEKHHPVYAPLYAAFTSVLAWLLNMSRSPAWRAMKSVHGLKCTNGELTLILAQAGQCRLSISSAPTPTLLARAALLPPNFLPLLCCIFTEQLCSLPCLVPNEKLG